MSQRPACSSCEWGGNRLFTSGKSLTLLTWQQHYPGGFHVMFLLLGSCPAEWGVGSGHQCLYNSLAGYTLCSSSNAQVPKSVIFAAKVCDCVLKSVLSSVTMDALFTSSVLDAKVCNTITPWTPKSVWGPKSVVPGGKVCFLFHLLSVDNSLILHQ